MAFDGIVTTAVTKELKDRLTGGKIDKIYQPSSDELFIAIPESSGILHAA